MPAARASDAPSLSRRGVAILLLLSLVQFMDILDASILNIALPSIKDDLGFSQQSLQWVVNGYILTYGGFLLLGGRARRPARAPPRCSSPGSSSSPARRWPAAWPRRARCSSARGFVQGIGAAMLSPAALSTLTTTFRSGRDRQHRARGLGGRLRPRRRCRSPLRRPAHGGAGLALGALRQRALQRGRARRRLRPAQARERSAPG